MQKAAAVTARGRERAAPPRPRHSGPTRGGARARGPVGNRKQRGGETGAGSNFEATPWTSSASHVKPSLRPNGGPAEPGWTGSHRAGRRAHCWGGGCCCFFIANLSNCQKSINRRRELNAKNIMIKYPTGPKAARVFPQTQPSSGDATARARLPRGPGTKPGPVLRQPGLIPARAAGDPARGRRPRLALSPIAHTLPF